MPTVHSMITRVPFTGDPPRDYIVNNVYHTIGDTGFDPSVDYDNHAQEVAKLFHGEDPTYGLFTAYGNSQITVKCYDISDPKPRPIRGMNIRGTSTDGKNFARPRELACCLSYYAGRNLPRQRGRIFIGAFNTAFASAGEKVDSTMLTNILNLGHGLFDIGGENVAHVVYSPTDHASHVVTDYWVNDVWDVMRSRREKEGTRSVLHP